MSESLPIWGMWYHVSTCPLILHSQDGPTGQLSQNLVWDTSFQCRLWVETAWVHILAKCLTSCGILGHLPSP